MGEAEAQVERQRQHPLPDRRARQDAVDEVRRGVGHAAAAARTAEPAALARVRHQAVVAAAVAVDAQEAVREDAALEELAELPLDERGRRVVPGAGAVEERLEAVGDDLVDDRAVRFAGGVGGRGAASGRVGGRAGPL